MPRLPFFFFFFTFFPGTNPFLFIFAPPLSLVSSFSSLQPAASVEDVQKAGENRVTLIVRDLCHFVACIHHTSPFCLDSLALLAETRLSTKIASSSLILII